MIQMTNRTTAMTMTMTMTINHTTLKKVPSMMEVAVKTISGLTQETQTIKAEITQNQRSMTLTTQ